jgi:hypothetical protein
MHAPRYQFSAHQCKAPSSWNIISNADSNANGMSKPLCISEGSKMQLAEHNDDSSMQEVIEIALGSEASNRLVQETALFSLGNMANHAAMVAVMQSSQIESKVNALLDSPHSNVRAVAARLASKLKAWSDTTH